MSRLVLSSAAIRSLLLQEKKLRANGARLVLLAPQPAILQALEMSGLLQQFAVFPSEEAAQTFLRDSASGPAATTTFAIGECTATLRRLPGAAAQSAICMPVSEGPDPFFPE